MEAVHIKKLEKGYIITEYEKQRYQEAVKETQRAFSTLPELLEYLKGVL